MEGSSKFILDCESFRYLLEHLQNKGYQIVGPKLKDRVINYDYIDNFDDLPVGCSDDQNNGYYRVKKVNDGSVFSNYTVGCNSVKKFIYPANRTILRIQKENGIFEFENRDYEIPAIAFIGLRACELAAIKIQDKILTQGAYKDIDYLRYREKMIIIAVNCTNPGNTCFCESMKTGPAVADGYDLVMTEINNQGSSCFVVKSGTEKGAEILSSIRTSKATEKHLSDERVLLEKAVAGITRKLEVDNLKNRLLEEFDNPCWDEIARRCLACGNCTMVCPTCFCTNIEDQTNLSGTGAERFRKWDSCFNIEFTHIHGGSIRSSAKSRYRQWLMHKLSYWHDQFETPGCVGCGRCITWCPVGIDITKEASRVCLKS